MIEADANTKGGATYHRASNVWEYEVGIPSSRSAPSPWVAGLCGRSDERSEVALCACRATRVINICILRI